MLSLSYSIVELDDIATEIESGIRDGATQGLKAAAFQVPNILRNNFLSKGTAGGYPAWPDISFRSLVFRRENRSVEQPLIDTGNLMNSGAITFQGAFQAYVTLANYGAAHDDGTAVTPEGVPVPQRPHMYLPEESLIRLDEAFERAYVGAN